LWLIDHGASIYFHHAWHNWEAHAERSFPAIKEHVLLPKASALPEAREAIQAAVSSQTIAAIIDTIPEDWLEEAGSPFSPAEKRTIYQRYLEKRLANIELLTKEAEDAR
ncbi:MAG: aminotransferase class I and II, partial [Phaeodactylibacter sp.]|nr:aminotransferase class I and II [Phaeodactylibacter sp.]